MSRCLLLHPQHANASFSGLVGTVWLDLNPNKNKVIDVFSGTVAGIANVVRTDRTCGPLC